MGTLSVTELPANILKYLCLVAFFKPYTDDVAGFFNYLNNIIFIRNPVPIRNLELYFNFPKKCFSEVFMDLPLEQHRIYFRSMYPYLKNRLLYINVRIYPINDQLKVQLSDLLNRFEITHEVKPKFIYISKENKGKFVDLLLN
jgi:hypothetical protein